MGRDIGLITIIFRRSIYRVMPRQTLCLSVRKAYGEKSEQVLLLFLGALSLYNEERVKVYLNIKIELTHTPVVFGARCIKGNLA